jgi:bacteriocin-like protein
MNLTHPFALDISDLDNLNLDFAEQLTDEETAQITGGLKKDEPTVTTLAVGEEGGDGGIQCISAPCPGSENGGHPSHKPPRPPKPHQPPVYTKALHENGGWIC